MSLGEVMNKLGQAELALKKQVFVGAHRRALKWFQESDVFNVTGSDSVPCVQIKGGKNTVAATAASKVSAINPHLIIFRDISDALLVIAANRSVIVGQGRNPGACGASGRSAAKDATL